MYVEVRKQIKSEMRKFQVVQALWKIRESGNFANVLSRAPDEVFSQHRNWSLCIIYVATLVPFVLRPGMRACCVNAYVRVAAVRVRCSCRNMFQCTRVLFAYSQHHKTKYVTHSNNPTLRDTNCIKNYQLKQCC